MSLCQVKNYKYASNEKMKYQIVHFFKGDGKYTPRIKCWLGFSFCPRECMDVAHMRKQTHRWEEASASTSNFFLHDTSI